MSHIEKLNRAIADAECSTVDGKVLLDMDTAAAIARLLDERATLRLGEVAAS